MGMALALLLLLANPTEAARPTKRQCLAACTERIAACQAEGQRYRKCKRRSVRACRRSGVEVCLPPSTTTTTLPAPPGSIALAIQGAFDVQDSVRVFFDVRLSGSAEAHAVPLDPSRFRIGSLPAVVDGSSYECNGELPAGGTRECFVFFDGPPLSGVMTFEAGGYVATQSYER